MSIISDPIGRALVLITLPLVLFAGPTAALDGAPEKILANGSMWTVNIDGFEFSIQLHGNEQQTGSSGWVRRGISGKHGKGLLNLKWRGRRATFKMTVPVSKGRQASCTGQPARDLSFLTGNCDAQVPFVMTPGSSPRRNARLIQTCERTNRNLKTQSGNFNRNLSQCQQALRTARQTPKAPQRSGRIDARDIARNAARHIPYRSQGGTCATCESVNVLDVPQNPRRNSLEGRWLGTLLNAQNTAIGDLFDSGGRRELRTQEKNICWSKQHREFLVKCAAIYRQSVITAAAAILRRAQ